MAKFSLALMAYGLFVAASALPWKHSLRYPLTLIPKSSFVSKKIVGGDDAYRGEFPHQISLLVDGGRHICGGSLIEVNGAQLVITAAHCFLDRFNYTLVAGSLKQSDRNQTGYTQSRPVTRVVIHEEYDTYFGHNDIALFFTDEPFNLNQYVQPIPLPRKMQETTGDAVVSGWGRLSAGGPQSDILQKLEISIVDESTCYRELGQYPIIPSQICAGFLDDGGTSPCFGDSGGPLKAVGGGYLAGIVSLAKTGCRFPGVYTKTSHFIDWIEENLYSCQGGHNCKK